MSNTVVGLNYKRILDAVIEASRTDFEENGVSNTVLESMRERWQQKLTESGRALFPWDEQPEPFSKIERHADSSPVALGIPGSQSNGFDYSNVKHEPDGNSFLSLPPRHAQAGIGTGYAQQRAAALMQQQFGSQANGSIGALQAAQMNRGYGNQAQQTYPQYPQQPPYAPQSQPQGQDQNQNQPPRTNAQPYIKQETENQRNGIDSAQTDGAADADDEWQAILAVRNAHGDHHPLGPVQADQTIRKMMLENAQRLEGGGLLLPLEERRPTAAPSRTATSSRANPRLGGDATEDDDADEDAINSDLDDPDETADTNLEGVYEGDVILCLYDKVQRVKNKWKCVLREGILTIDGKDYVFHKATGECEW